MFISNQLKNDVKMLYFIWNPVKHYIKIIFVGTVTSLIFELKNKRNKKTVFISWLLQSRNNSRSKARESDPSLLSKTGLEKSHFHFKTSKMEERIKSERKIFNHDMIWYEKNAEHSER